MKSSYLSDKEYKNILEITPVCTVDVLFFNHDKSKILLFKRRSEPLKNKYFSCGGRLFKNEGFIDCALRIVFDEVGLRFKKKDLRFGGIQNEIHNNSKYSRINYHAVNIFYWVVLLNNINITLDSQHIGYKWFDINNKNLHKFIRGKISKIVGQ